MSKLVNNACLWWKKNWIFIFWIPYFLVLPPLGPTFALVKCVTHVRSHPARGRCPLWSHLWVQSKPGSSHWNVKSIKRHGVEYLCRALLVCPLFYICILGYKAQETARSTSRAATQKDRDEEWRMKNCLMFHPLRLQAGTFSTHHTKLCTENFVSKGVCRVML